MHMVLMHEMRFLYVYHIAWRVVTFHTRNAFPTAVSKPFHGTAFLPHPFDTQNI